MRIRTPAELGRLVRDTRESRRLSRNELAALADVSPRWLVDFEGGKPGAAIGHVLRCLDALALDIDVTSNDDDGLQDAPRLLVDLDRHLAAYLDNDR